MMKKERDIRKYTKETKLNRKSYKIAEEFQQKCLSSSNLFSSTKSKSFITSKLPSAVFEEILSIVKAARFSSSLALVEALGII